MEEFENAPVTNSEQSPTVTESPATDDNPIELRSEEISAILGRAPNSLIRYGIMVIFGTLLLVFTGTVFFSYPDIIHSPIIITSSNPPAHLTVHTSGHIQHLLVSDRQEVTKGQPLAVMENQADFKDVRLLEQLLDTLKQLGGLEHINANSLNPNMHLGDITPSFLDFQKALREYESFNTHRQQGGNNQTTDYIRQQRKLADNVLYTSGNLLYQINLWKEKYIYASPCEGSVSLTKIKMSGQAVTVGNLLMSIISSQPGTITGKAEIPVSAYGKTKPGQSANIKLDGYPFMEFGIIKGIVTTIVPVPIDGFYHAEVELPNGLISNYGNHIPFNHEMTGTVDIITQEQSLFQRLLQPVRAAISRK